jgi:uncharacterized protein
MVIPIEESLLYVRPLYLRAQAGRIPELTRVIVAYQNQIVMERTLDGALARLFGGPLAASGRPGTPVAPVAPVAPGAPEHRIAPAAPSAPGAVSEGDLQQLAADAQATYERALAAQRAGDWAKYGEEIRRLGDVLQKMRKPD